MTWPDGSWAFSKLLGDKMIRTLASTACVMVALEFIIGGTGLLINQIGWRSLAVIAAVFSIVTFSVFWNGKLREVSDQGGVGILIRMCWRS
jgi:hypothetical protein